MGMKRDSDIIAWKDASIAPLGIKIEVMCVDNVTGEYTLPYPCRRTVSAWVNADTNAIIDCTPVGWRQWKG